MKTVKILHCADLHLDTSFAELSLKQASIRKEELKANFSKIIEMANQNQVELLLISGDIFDKETVSKQTVDFFISKLNELSATYVALIAGNHDSINKNYFYNHVKWPDYVHFFSETPDKVHIEHLGVNVYGASFYNPYMEKNAFHNFAIEDENTINILLMHGELVSEGSKSHYNPITPKLIKGSKADYIALGHVHTYSGINNIDNVHWAYSGTPAGKGFDECGQKGVIIGSVGKGFNQLDFVPIEERIYHEIEIDISAIGQYEDLLGEIEQHLNEKDLYKVAILGEKDDSFNINCSQIADYFKDKAFFIKVLDQTSLKIDYNQLAIEDSLKSAYVLDMYKIMEKSSSEEKEIIEKAMQLGVKALNGEGLVLDDH